MDYEDYESLILFHALMLLAEDCDASSESLVSDLGLQLYRLIIKTRWPDPRMLRMLPGYVSDKEANDMPLSEALARLNTILSTALRAEHLERGFLVHDLRVVITEVHERESRNLKEVCKILENIKRPPTTEKQ